MSAEQAPAPAAPATQQPGSDNPFTPETRQCRVCDQTKAVSPETWPYRSRSKGKPYQAYGAVCRECESKRKAAYEERRGQIAAIAALDAVDVKDTKAETKAANQQSKLEVAAALKLGTKALNSIAPNVLARIISWAEDETHEQHVWANEFLANRILPKRLFEELGGEAAGLGALGDKRPQYLIQILPATPDVPQGRVLDVTPETVTFQLEASKE